MVLSWAKNVKGLESNPFIHFLNSLEAKKQNCFWNEELSNQRLKHSSICNLWSWTKLFIDDNLLSLISFIDWLGSRWGLVLFFVALFSLSCAFGDQCMLFVYFRMLNWHFPFIYIHFYFTYKKIHKNKLLEFLVMIFSSKF